MKMALVLVIAFWSPMWLSSCDEYGQCSYDLIAGPEYYTTQYVEPDWCLYGTGDEVSVEFDQRLQPVSWFVTPASDPNRDGDHAVINDSYGCWLFAYPW